MMRLDPKIVHASDGLDEAFLAWKGWFCKRLQVAAAQPA